jgi:hypothetical protein
MWIPSERVDVSTSVSRGRVVLEDANRADAMVLIGFLMVLAYPLYVARGLLRASYAIPFMAVVAAVILYKRFVVLRLKSYDLPGDEQRLLQTARREARGLGWRITSAGEHYMIAAAGETDLSWGQFVTIIARPNRLYLNSRNRSGSRAKSSLAVGRNRKHLSDLVARMQTTQLAPPTSAPHELIGRWHLVHASRETTRDLEMEIRGDGRLLISVPFGKRRQVVEGSYEIEGDLLVADVPSTDRQSRNHFFLESDGTLRLENPEGRSWFARTA